MKKTVPYFEAEARKAGPSTKKSVDDKRVTLIGPDKSPSKKSTKAKKVIYK